MKKFLKKIQKNIYRVKGAREVWYLVQKYRCKTGVYILKGNDLDDLEEKNVNWTLNDIFWHSFGYCLPNSRIKPYNKLRASINILGIKIIFKRGGGRKTIFREKNTQVQDYN